MNRLLNRFVVISSPYTTPSPTVPLHAIFPPTSFYTPAPLFPTFTQLKSRLVELSSSKSKLMSSV